MLVSDGTTYLHRFRTVSWSSPAVLNGVYYPSCSVTKWEGEGNDFVLTYVYVPSPETKLRVDDFC